MIIDLGEVEGLKAKNNQYKKLKNGIYTRLQCNLDYHDVNTKETIYILIPSEANRGMSFNFYVGLFNKSLYYLGEKEFNKRYKIRFYS